MTWTCIAILKIPYIHVVQFTYHTYYSRFQYNHSASALNNGYMFAELVRWPKIKICMSWVEIYIKNCVKKDGRSLSQRHYTQCWLLMYRPNVICCSSHGELKCHYITRFPSHYHIHDTKNPNRWVWVGLQVSWYKAKFLPQILLLLAGQRISSSPASQII